MSEDAKDAELSELRAWKAEVLRRNAVPPRIAADTIERLESEVARLTREWSAMNKAADRFCADWKAALARAEKAERECDEFRNSAAAEAEAADEARKELTATRSDLRALADAARRYQGAEDRYGALTSRPGPVSRAECEVAATELREAAAVLRNILSRLAGKDGAKCGTCAGFERVCRCHGEPPNALCYELIPCPACKGGKDGAK